MPWQLRTLLRFIVAAAAVIAPEWAVADGCDAALVESLKNSYKDAKASERMEVIRRSACSSKRTKSQASLFGSYNSSSIDFRQSKEGAAKACSSRKDSLFERHLSDVAWSYLDPAVIQNIPACSGRKLWIKVVDTGKEVSVSASGTAEGEPYTVKKPAAYTTGALSCSVAPNGTLIYVAGKEVARCKRIGTPDGRKPPLLFTIYTTGGDISISVPGDEFVPYSYGVEQIPGKPVARCTLDGVQIGRTISCANGLCVQTDLLKGACKSEHGYGLRFAPPGESREVVAPWVASLRKLKTDWYLDCRVSGAAVGTIAVERTDTALIALLSRRAEARTGACVREFGDRFDPWTETLRNTQRVTQR